MIWKGFVMDISMLIDGEERHAEGNATFERLILLPGKWPRALRRRA
jgi:hypothetical protein